MSCRSQKTRVEPVWPHAPSHKLSEAGAYLVTSSTYRKQHFFNTPIRLDVLHRGLLTVAAEAGWRLEAWAMFSNHYHFVGHSPAEGAGNLSAMLGRLHSRTAAWLNRVDNESGRQVWHNYWESHITFQRAYLARLSYVHLNPVKHGLVLKASDYRWCSAGWLERTASEAQVRTLLNIKTDKLAIFDDFEPIVAESIES